MYVWRSERGTIPNEDCYGFVFWMEATDKVPGKRRDVIAIDFESMIKETYLLDAFRGLFTSLKRSIALNRVSYNSPEAYYLIQQIYEAA